MIATTRLGSSGPSVSRVALGCLGMSGMYGPSDRAESIATIHEAIERGVTLLDTGDFYGMGHNEMLLAEALRDRRDKVLLSVKFGAMRAPGGAWTGVDARPQAVKNFAAYSLQRLGTDHIDIYRPSRLDATVPIEDTVGAIADLVREGHVRYIGLSEVGAETARRARAVHPVTDLQIEYSLVSRGIEGKILPALRELGIGVTAYGVLSRGLLSGSKTAGHGDFRAHMPRFREENLRSNRDMVARLAAAARERGLTQSQLAIAWVQAQGPDIVPVIGARTRPQLAEALGAFEVRLSPEDIAGVGEICHPSRVAGARYDPAQMRMLDSER